ncbi:MAG TPA: hypothetical protein PLD20_21030 [Blastocatellia bacterium]|nr:hypothetical protein [Blastocatellia bacterium]HMV81594.1 hypothetical protein [Blastocatellia bacterium]HMX24370.1 hypothetical protein [Blastocatellia bacterium]HMY74539.1 hypothetical protein [Blastocatellia bacterium]HMZ20434.1 hypothetical protein [Blastocatellia bacterium]
MERHILRFFLLAALGGSLMFGNAALAQQLLEPAAGKLNEFVLDGTESCVEIKRGSSSIRPVVAAVTNVANYSNRLAPGGLAAVWGLRFSEVGEEHVAPAAPFSRLLGRVQVLWRAADWDGMISGAGNRCGWRAAPLLYVGPEQINFQVPMFYYKPFSEEEGNGYGRFSNFEGREYEFIVLRLLPDGFTRVTSNTFTLKVNSHAPEFFSNAVREYPSWQVPAEIAPGQTMVAYLTGLGKISDHEPEGFPPPNPPWTTSFPTYVEYRTSFGTRLLRAGYLFAGRAPGFVGVDQVNFLIPFLPVGFGQPVSIHICTGADNADRCSEKGMTFFYRAP